jgi:hypothetical protein
VTSLWRAAVFHLWSPKAPRRPSVRFRVPPHWPEPAAMGANRPPLLSGGSQLPPIADGTGATRPGRLPRLQGRRRAAPRVVSVAVAGGGVAIGALAGETGGSGRLSEILSFLKTKSSTRIRLSASSGFSAATSADIAFTSSSSFSSDIVCPAVTERIAFGEAAVLSRSNYSK